MRWCTPPLWSPRRVPEWGGQGFTLSPSTGSPGDEYGYGVSVGSFQFVHSSMTIAEDIEGGGGGSAPGTRWGVGVWGDWFGDGLEH